MISLNTENIPCDGNRMVIYSPNMANIKSPCDFTGKFKEYNYTGQIVDGTKYECKYMVSDENVVTCDFVSIVILNVSNVTSKICELSFPET